MSHFVKTKTSLSDVSVLKRALKRMGFEAIAENTTVEQYGTSEKVALLLDKGDNSKGAVGLSLQEDGTYSVVGDPYHATNRQLKNYYGKQEKLSHDLGTAYAIEKAVMRIEEAGFFIEENAEAKIGSDGMIQLVAVRY